jgi:hypothetical protein
MLFEKSGDTSMFVAGGADWHEKNRQMHGRAKAKNGDRFMIRVDWDCGET